MEKYILDIDARVGKRGKREVMRFAGSMTADEIEAYKTEMQMTKSDMEASKESASASAAAAATSAEEAAASDKSAKTSADAARDSASSALQSATGAEGSATAAANSATAAGKSASAANLSVLQAGTFADNASTSADEAAASATAAAKSAAEAAVGVAGVSTFNGRNGAVMPQSGDYSYDMITGTPPTTTYEAATETTDGLMSKTDKAKLDGIATGATKTVTDTAVTENSSNPVSSSGIYAAINAVKDSIVSTVTDAIGSIKTAIGNASASAAGLMSAADKTKLDGIAEGATKVTVDSAVTEGSSNAASSGGVFVAIKAVKDGIVDTVISAIESIRTAIGDATTSARGLMTAADKTKLNGVAEGANKTTLIDNLTTTTAGLGALDAHAGYSLKQDLANALWKLIVDQPISSTATTIALPLDAYRELLFCIADGENLSVGVYPTSLLKCSAARILLSSMAYDGRFYGGWFNRSSAYQISDVLMFSNGIITSTSARVYIYGKN